MWKRSGRGGVVELNSPLGRRGPLRVFFGRELYLAERTNWLCNVNTAK